MFYVFRNRVIQNCQQFFLNQQPRLTNVVLLDNKVYCIKKTLKIGGTCGSISQTLFWELVLIRILPFENNMICASVKFAEKFITICYRKGDNNKREQYTIWDFLFFSLQYNRYPYSVSQYCRRIVKEYSVGVNYLAICR